MYVIVRYAQLSLTFNNMIGSLSKELVTASILCVVTRVGCVILGALSLDRSHGKPLVEL